MEGVDANAIIGTTLVDGSGRHAARIVSLIGSGSFAHVYLAEDALANANTQQPPAKIAVKRLFKAGLDARQLQVQRQEAAIMAALDHPNIIRLIATAEDEECLYLMMEYCELDLYEAITQQGGFPEDVVKEVFGQVADAILFCHSRGFYHRDLKPENCLISTADYKIKLADFGLATTDTWSTEMGCGSVRYMAPECFEAGHNKSDPSIPNPYSSLGPDGQPILGYAPGPNDVWALGVILLNLLFGKNPWYEAYATDQIFAAFSGPNPNVLRQQFDLSPHFDGVLRRVFDLDPRRRCSVSDLKLMVEALPSFVGGGALPPPPPVPNIHQVIQQFIGPPGMHGLVLPAGVAIPAGYPGDKPAGTLTSRRGSKRLSHARPVSVATTISALSATPQPAAALSPPGSVLARPSAPSPASPSSELVHDLRGSRGGASRHVEVDDGEEVVIVSTEDEDGVSSLEGSPAPPPSSGSKRSAVSPSGVARPAQRPRSVSSSSLRGASILSAAEAARRASKEGGSVVGPTPPISRPVTPRTSRVASPIAPVARDSGYESVENKVGAPSPAAAAPATAAAPAAATAEPAPLPKGAMRVERGDDVEAEALSALGRMEAATRPTSAVKPTPAFRPFGRRSPSPRPPSAPRRVFSPVMTRETVVAGGAAPVTRVHFLSRFGVGRKDRDDERDEAGSTGSPRSLGSRRSFGTFGRRKKAAQQAQSNLASAESSPADLGGGSVVVVEGPSEGSTPTTGAGEGKDEVAVEEAAAEVRRRPSLVKRASDASLRALAALRGLVVRDSASSVKEPASGAATAAQVGLFGRRRRVSEDSLETGVGGGAGGGWKRWSGVGLFGGVNFATAPAATAKEGAEGDGGATVDLSALRPGTPTVDADATVVDLHAAAQDAEAGKGVLGVRVIQRRWSSRRLVGGGGRE